MQIDPVRYEALLETELQSKRVRRERDEWRTKYFEMERAQSRSIDTNGEHVKRIQLLEREKDEVRSKLARVEAELATAKYQIPDYVCPRCQRRSFGNIPCVYCERDRLEQENIALREWRDSVSRAIKTIPEFHTGKWGGDKEGWGFHFELVNWLRRDHGRLEQENKRLKAPVTVMEWSNGCPVSGDGFRLAANGMTIFDRIIAARAEQEKGEK